MCIFKHFRNPVFLSVALRVKILKKKCIPGEGSNLVCICEARIYIWGLATQFVSDFILSLMKYVVIAK